MRSREIAKTFQNVRPGEKIPESEELAALDPEDDLTCYFPDPPATRGVHLIAQLPAGKYLASACIAYRVFSLKAGSHIL